VVNLPLYDPLRWDFTQREHAIYDQLRATEPMHWAAHRDEWVATSYAAVREIIRHPGLTPIDFPLLMKHTAAGAPLPAAQAVIDAVSFFKTGAGHALARRQFSKALNEGPLTGLAESTRLSAQTKLAALVAAGGGDLIRDVARPVPYEVMGQLLGVPLADLPALITALDGAVALLFQYDSQLVDLVAANHSLTSVLSYMEGLVAERRRQPRADGLSRLISASSETPASDRQNAAQILFLFLAGVETTISLLGASLLSLLEHPGEAERWRQGQVGSDTAVTELIRYHAPVAAAVRCAVEDGVIAGTPVNAGQRIIARLAAANRDPVVYPDPHRLDLGRKAAPNLSFGDGAYQCMGAAISRMEATAILPEALKVPSLKVSGPISEQRMYFLTTWQSIPVESS